ncbi:MAG: hypothetical protein A7316_07235 [Candidatus Altiarchaeales archaeon WOR_SM1_86-2]|nr:MAG: hypothetical protein A7316_07235 [Candidatus Altiarchaeales archaeon WOR_SM1_86-2]
MAEKEEKTYTIPLRQVYDAPRTKRASKAIKVVRQFLVRHAKIGDVHLPPENIVLDKSLNEAVWARGIQKPPRRIRVSVAEDEKGRMVASLVE